MHAEPESVYYGPMRVLFDLRLNTDANGLTVSRILMPDLYVLNWTLRRSLVLFICCVRSAHGATICLFCLKYADGNSGGGYGIMLHGQVRITCSVPLPVQFFFFVWLYRRNSGPFEWASVAISGNILLVCGCNMVWQLNCSSQSTDLWVLQLSKMHALLL